MPADIDLVERVAGDILSSAVGALLGTVFGLYLMPWLMSCGMK
jgi:hypothetical protein